MSSSDGTLGNARSSRRNLDYGWFAIALMCAYAIARSLVAAAHKPLWFDEICTFIIVHHPAGSSILGCLRSAMDAQPPLYYVLEKICSPLPFPAEISLRIPSIAAFCVALICVYLIIRRHAGEAVAVICALTLFPSGAFRPFAIEARPYELIVAATALAIVGYQHASSRWGPWLLAFTLVFGECMHYYMIFVIICFAGVEAIFVAKTRSVRKLVWTGIGLATIPLAACWPLLEVVKKYYGAHLWAAPSMRTLWLPFSVAFDVPGSGMWLGLALITASVAVLFWKATWTFTSAQGREETPVFCERLLIAGLTLMPFLQFAAAKISGGGYTGRYALPLILAVPLTLSAYMRHFRARWGVVVVTALLASLVVYREASFWRRPKLETKARVQKVEELVGAAKAPELPVMVASGLEYLEFVHYSSDLWQNRFVYPVDNDVAIQYSGTDSVERDLLAVNSCSQLDVPQFRNFAAEHPVFLLYAEAVDDGHEWWPRALKQVGFSLEEIGSDGNRELYMVKAK